MSRIGVTALLAFGLALALYGATVAPDVLWGDLAEFQANAAELRMDFGPRDYPVYRLLTWLAGLVPAGTLALRVNLVSALFGAGAVALLYVALRRQGRSGLAASAGAGALAVSHGLWSQSVVAEVYTLHAFLVAALLATLTWDRRLSPRRIVLAGALLGIGWLHHRTVVFLYPACLVFLFMRRGDLGAGRRARAATVVGAILAIVPALGLLLVGGQGESALSLLDGDGPGLAERVKYVAGFILLDFPIPSPALLLILLPVFRPRGRDPIRAFALTAILVHLAAVLFLAWFGDQHVYLLPAFLLAAPLLAEGLDRLRGWRAKPALAAALLCVAAPPLVYIGAAAYFSRPGAPEILGGDRAYHRQILLPSKCGYRVPRQFAEDVLRRIPPRSRILSGWADGHALRYLQSIEGRRPDVVVTICDSDRRLRRALQAFDGPVYLTRFPHFAGRTPPPTLPPGYRYEGEGTLLEIRPD